MIIPQEYITLRRDLKFNDVSLGYITVYLFKEEELNGAQFGYGIDVSGQSLISDREGDWKENWLVIGYEDNCGGPVIIDLFDTNFPVYTSMHGVGYWRLTLISESFLKFIQNLEWIKLLSVGRENPVLVEQNPISEIEKNNALENIRLSNPNSNLSFWEIWLGYI